MTTATETIRPLNTLKVGDMLTDAEVKAHFNGQPGWNGGVYVCDGAHRDGTWGFKVLEVRSARPSWSF